MACSAHVAARRVRMLHTSAALRQLVGPSDPISNLRPVLYDDPRTPRTPADAAHAGSGRIRHPYSLREFTSARNAPADRGEYHLRIQKQQLDAFNHAFWTETNTRFESAKASILSALPPSAPPLTREATLSQFYRSWALQETARQRAYTTEWRRRNWELIALSARVRFRQMRTALGVA